MKVICINSEGKPDKIPLEEWIQEGEMYTVYQIDRMGLQHGNLLRIHFLMSTMMLKDLDQLNLC